MALLRGKIRWTVPGAGSAHSVLHFGQLTGDSPNVDMANEIVTRMNTFITGIRNYIPQAVSMQALADVEAIDQPTGELLSVVTGTTVAAQAGAATSTATWAAPVGAVISWQTSQIVRGRRLRGRTFLVPCSSTAFQTDGTIDSTVLTTFGNAATGLRTAGTLTELVVYSRPTGPGATDGTGGVVNAHRIPDMAAVLRSRRS